MTPGAAVASLAGFVNVGNSHLFQRRDVLNSGRETQELLDLLPERLRGLGHVEVAVLTEVEDVAVVLATDEGDGHYCCSGTENSRGARAQGDSGWATDGESVAPDHPVVVKRTGIPLTNHQIRQAPLGDWELRLRKW